MKARFLLDTYVDFFILCYILGLVVLGMICVDNPYNKLQYIAYVSLPN
jgi:hypothetical protein